LPLAELDVMTFVSSRGIPGTIAHPSQNLAQPVPIRIGASVPILNQRRRRDIQPTTLSWIQLDSVH
jgi:hypothetical protein